MKDLYKLSEDRNYLEGLVRIKLSKTNQWTNYYCVYTASLLTELQEALDEHYKEFKGTCGIMEVE